MFGPLFGRRLQVLLWLVLALITTSGCAALPALAPDQERRQQRVEGLTITLDTRRGPLVNQTQLLRVTLTDETGRPLEHAMVTLDFDMDLICLSQGARIADEVARGQYEVQTVYLMAGDWEVTVLVEVNGQERRALFMIPVADADQASGAGRYTIAGGPLTRV